MSITGNTGSRTEKRSSNTKKDTGQKNLKPKRRMIQMEQLTAYERETIILFSDDSNECVIDTLSKAIQRRLDGLCTEFPNEYQLEAHDDKFGAKRYRTQKLNISFRKPRKLSSATLDRLRTSMETVRKGKPSKA